MKKTIFRLLILCIAASMIVMPVYADSESTEVDSIIDDIITNINDLPNEQPSIPNTEAEKITIAFKLGDSVLKINGEDVTVTTPFEQNGTTLVPLRVITEAFGAKVDWSDAEQSVTLTYNEVVIKIWIDRTDALVNGQKSTLLLAPQLVNDTTMVPLRFITENFGADVSYDDATEAILVEKTISGSSAVSDYSSILHNTDKEYVGDSYYGWSMKSSKDLDVVTRTFDGTLTGLKNSENSAIIISIGYIGDKEKDEIFSNIKQSVKNLTIAKQNESKDAEGNDCIQIEAKDSASKLLIKAIIKNNKLYIVSATAMSEDNADEFLNLASTFSVAVTDFSNAVDLSDIEDGKRVYENKNLKFKIELPADWYETSNRDVENQIEFSNRKSGKGSYSRIYVSIQSKDNMLSAEQWAKQDYEGNKAAYNPDYAEFSDSILDGTIAGIPSNII